VTPPIFRPLGQPETRFADEKGRDPVKCATRRPVLAGMEELFQSGSMDQKRSSTNWPLAKILQRYINHVTRRLGLITVDV
jgi:hypothetical protein